MVGGICSLLPYGTGICHYAFNIILLFNVSVHSYGTGICHHAFYIKLSFILFLSIPFIYLKNNESMNQMAWSSIRACAGLICFYNTGNIQETNCRNIYVWSLCVDCFCGFDPRQDLRVMNFEMCICLWQCLIIIMYIIIRSSTPWALTWYILT